jgi:hypothetical protein
MRIGKHTNVMRAIWLRLPPLVRWGIVVRYGHDFGEVPARVLT